MAHCNFCLENSRIVDGSRVLWDGTATGIYTDNDTLNFNNRGFHCPDRSSLFFALWRCSPQNLVVAASARSMFLAAAYSSSSCLNTNWDAIGTDPFTREKVPKTRTPKCKSGPMPMSLGEWSHLRPVRQLWINAMTPQVSAIFQQAHGGIRGRDGESTHDARRSVCAGPSRLGIHDPMSRRGPADCSRHARSCGYYRDVRRGKWATQAAMPPEGSDDHRVLVAILHPSTSCPGVIRAGAGER
ncbi:hypothetical protein B0H19DRAFT_1236755 [Mycena capillaripes]|nr:hypothetical protein B0H19DRAFT_1236755 [Mycena capillaripes]